MRFIIMLIVGGLIGWLAGAILGKDVPFGIIAGLIGSAIGSNLLGQLGPILGGVPILPALIGSIIYSNSSICRRFCAP